MILDDVLTNLFAIRSAIVIFFVAVVSPTNVAVECHLTRIKNKKRKKNTRKRANKSDPICIYVIQNIC